MTARALPVPSGCRWCGIPQREHFRRWSTARHDTTGTGWHQWEQPTDAQNLARMEARRAAKQQPPDTSTV